MRHADEELSLPQGGFESQVEIAVRGLLTGSALYLIALSAWLSHRQALVLDEFFAWNLLSDPSLSHALHSWYMGADSGGLLYYVLLWPLLHIGHPSTMVARLFSAVCYVLTIPVWLKVLGRWFSVIDRSLGIFLIWLSSSLMLGYIAQIRFYTAFVLFAALATQCLLVATDASDTPKRTFLLICVSQMCLVQIHMLGILYSGCLLLGMLLLTSISLRQKVLITLASAVAWSTLVPCLGAVQNGSFNAASQSVPALRDILRYYLKSSEFPPVILLAVIGVAFLLFEATRGRSRNRQLLLSLMFLLGPCCIYLVSHLGRPLGATRYIIPYYLSLAVLCCAGISALLAINRGPTWMALASTALLFLTIALHFRALHSLPDNPVPQAYVSPGQPIVVEDEQDFFQLQYYRSSSTLQFYFLLPHEPNQSRGMMAAVAQNGYFGRNIVSFSSLESRFPQFLFIPRASDKPDADLLQSGCHIKLVTYIELRNALRPLYAVSACHATQKRT